MFTDTHGFLRRNQGLLIFGRNPKIPQHLKQLLPLNAEFGDQVFDFHTLFAHAYPLIKLLAPDARRFKPLAARPFPAHIPSPSGHNLFRVGNKCPVRHICRRAHVTKQLPLWKTLSAHNACAHGNALTPRHVPLPAFARPAPAHPHRFFLPLPVPCRESGS